MLATILSTFIRAKSLPLLERKHWHDETPFFPCYGTYVNMFERVVSYFLQKYLGWLVKGLDAEALNVSIWGGDIVLNNLELQENALDFLHLPVQVKNGCLQQLKLQIPWTSLGSSQTVIEISGLYAWYIRQTNLNTTKRKKNKC